MITKLAKERLLVGTQNFPSPYLANSFFYYNVRQNSSSDVLNKKDRSLEANGMVGSIPQPK